VSRPKTSEARDPVLKTARQVGRVVRSEPTTRPRVTILGLEGGELVGAGQVEILVRAPRVR